MFVWFSMLAILGAFHIMDDLSIIKAFNPFYAVNFLSTYPGGFWLLGAVFLCTTGAEALYSDLGHCGRGNIRISWIFVKTCLLLNYFGQAAYLLANRQGITATAAIKQQLNINAFYDLMPQWFLLVGIVIATTSAIIASQAMISGSFTLISEAMRLNLWPKLKIRYPSDEKGQFLFKELECEKEYYVKTQFGDEFEVAQNKYITGATLGETKVEVVLEKRVKVGTDLAQEFVISSIYFDTDKYNINKAASVELYKLVEIMTQNPKIKIEVRSHTDSRQTVAYNQVLSNKRAKSTVKWLINHGISPSRLIGIGLGESELLSPCADDCSSEEHQKNRRSDFVIIKT